MRSLPRGPGAAAVALALIATAAPAAPARADGTAVTVADKGFTESRIVAQLYAQALRARGFTVTLRSYADTPRADAAVRAGRADVYPEYTGTALLTVLRRRPAADAATVFAQVRDAYAGRGLAALPPAPYDNGNEVVCTRAAARRYRLTTLSSLAPSAPRLAYAANSEHLTRADGLPVLAREYGVRFGRILTTGIDARYAPLRRGAADCAYAFATDPQIVRDRLVVLRDDRGRFTATPYQSFPVVRRGYLDTAPPEFRATVDRVSAALDRRAIVALNGQVAFRGRSPAAVAGAFLRTRGLVPG